MRLADLFVGHELGSVKTGALTPGVASDVKPVRGCQIPLGTRDRLRPTRQADA